MENLTVGALKELLKGVSDETLIVAAIDPEGNAYRPLTDPPESPLAAAEPSG